MTLRRNIPVDVVRKPESGSSVVIRRVSGAFELTTFDGALLATCTSAKRLSDWAFDLGVFEVCHAYDLKLSDSEP